VCGWHLLSFPACASPGFSFPYTGADCELPLEVPPILEIVAIIRL
jgi:hypothetical protein